MIVNSKACGNAKCCRDAVSASTPAKNDWLGHGICPFH